ncbi:beta-mannosidase [Diaminobutyricimonas aerilata]|uniref:beta-mannosidase n=1 Tax=Diaminobutyricimonas aerilata TaxID=1162967 RepID=A0A2M9CM75_9MICO|nr:glycoside hydrolase family 2 protein [Diaminobutyricimonas aerilata]PJJ72984.1 beta-mannosidase [Diaminobutyricimonas aerilata]
MTSTRTPIHEFAIAATEPGIADPRVALDAAHDWIPAIVPGGVHESLLAAERIPHPYRDRNETEIRWVEERDWWYRGRFAAPVDLADDERLRLVFHGLDTVVDVWLNGEKLGSHENMFRPAVFDVTSRALADNELALRFSPPLAGLEVPESVTEMGRRLGDAFSQLAPEPGPDDAPAEGEGMMSENLPLSTLRRKATFSWGWDFGPRVPSIGIWRAVELVREKRAVISGHHVRTDHVDVDGARAALSVLVEVDRFAGEGPLRAEVTLTAPDGRAKRVPLVIPAGESEARARVEVDDARLWWTHDLGDPALYDVAVVLSADDIELDRVTDRVGLRTVKIEQPADFEEGGRQFRFVLNGVPLFARGAAWLPASMFVGSVSPERHRDLVGLARDGGMNMLRIWGGGIYEQDAFYAATDEAGVLVWHDFMFACIDYPSEDPTLQREVAAEAEYQVKRLRNRASMALWSGNNEVQLIHGFAWQNYEPGDWGYDFFYRILPDAVERFDGGTPYWPGSPWGEAPEEGFMAVNGVLDGDRHAWEVWHGFDFGAGGGPFESVGESRHYRRYALDKGKFISEFGIHAAPELSTLQRWIRPDDLTVHSESFDHHNKDNPKDKHDPVLEIVTGLPETIGEYVDFTMVSQGEGLKFGIEHYRRRFPHCSGTLVWQFNDVWPGFSWSVIDYDLVPKAGYYFAKRAYSPVLASFRESDDGALELWLSNSGRHSRIVRAVVTLARFEGAADRVESVEEHLPAGASRVAWRAQPGSYERGPDRLAWVSSPDDAFPPNRLFFSEVKDTHFGNVTLETRAEPDGPGAATVSITAHGYAYLVRVLSPAPGVRLSDNYFDLRDGEARVVQVSGLPDGFDLERLVVDVYAGQR